MHVGVRLDDVDSGGSRVCSINSMQQPFCISLLMVSIEVQLYTIPVRVALQGLPQAAIQCNPPSNQEAMHVPVIDVNVAKRDINVPISAAAMMLKMMEAVIMMPITVSMSHLMLIMLMMIMRTMMKRKKMRGMNRIPFILVREL